MNSTLRGAQYWTVSTLGSYLSSNDKRVHFGLEAGSVAIKIDVDPRISRAKAGPR